MALIRVALAQLNMSVGDLEANALKLMDAYEHHFGAHTGLSKKK